MDEKLWWYVARAGGLTAWWLLCVAVLWGLLLSSRVLGERTPPAWLLDLHRMLGGLAVVFTATHLVGLYLDTWAGFTLEQLFVPLASDYRPAAVAWGVVGLYLLTAVEVTSLLRRRLPDRLWRWVHRSAFCVFALATVHAFTAGSDAASPWVQGTAVVMVLGFVFLSAYRVMAGRRGRERPEIAPPASTPARPPGGPAFHPLTVAEVNRETDDAVSVAFAVPQELAPDFRFDPGQHVTLRRRLDDDEVRRSYSLCCGVTDGELRIAVKNVEGGRASPWLTRELEVGDVVEVAAPTGRFRTDINPLLRRHVLGVAAGSGITPVLSILKSVLAVEPRSRFTLLYGNRDVGSIIFRDQLSALQEQYGERLRTVHVLSRCHEVEPRLRGRIDAAKLRELADELGLAGVDEAFVCGPRDMTMEVRAALTEHGMDPADVHVELFGGARPATGPAATGVRRTVALVDRGARSEVITDAGESVLDAALRAGVELPYSCRDGVCGTCRARLDSGQVDQPMAELSPQEVEAGYVLTCQARPRTDDVVISLDDR
ncbi:MAG: 2Fe-2S iron-sulfur cluster-binding protein [Actinomycetota bacterium]|nr:2Fe-2S iron-sulfur cluster-binding protein [Actinomycetota bacterium]